ncbi:transposase [Streptomyces sp. NPDC001833]|uniref:transposase n=1 Tax=Streptomyces sp. NPDC001833 TaxID=3154658 RepID=UPI0033336C7E
MLSRGDLTDDEWAVLEPLLSKSNNRCGRWRDHRQVINGIIHRLSAGCQWRQLPARFGPWQTIHKRHSRWSCCLGDPGRGRVRGRAQDASPAAGLLDHRQYVQSRAGEGDSLEEVARQHRVGLRTQEGAPLLWSFAARVGRCHRRPSGEGGGLWSPPPRLRISTR